MAESKPTKLQMAKEIQYLIAAAQDMSAVMDLDPVIKTDYLIDLKNKTVTATHLQNVVSNLQADIKRDAKMIEPQDKFQPGTHAVLCNLNIKVPRPAAKEEVVEDEGDDVMPTPSPPMEEEVKKKEKPIKKEKKNATDHSKSNKGQVYIAWKNGENDFEKLSEKIDGAVKLSTIKGWCNAWKNGKNLPAIAKQ